MKRYQIIERILTKLGGPGSGNWGHAGRPGHRGGSMPRSGAMSIRTGKDWEKRQAAAKKSAKSTFGQSPVKEARKLGRGEKGVNDSVVLEFEDGTKGIFKDEKMAHGSVEGEILAYEFSESIGWGLVPETMLFSESGKRGSLQQWVDGTETAVSYIGPKTSQTLMQEDRMRTMDALLGNGDRHGGNYLYNQDGSRLWAIDNGGFFGIGFGRYTYTPEMRPSRTSPEAWMDVAAWSKTPKAKSFVTRVSNLMGHDYADRLTDFLEKELPRNLPGGGPTW